MHFLALKLQHRQHLSLSANLNVPQSSVLLYGQEDICWQCSRRPLHAESRNPLCPFPICYCTLKCPPCLKQTHVFQCLFHDSNQALQSNGSLLTKKYRDCLIILHRPPEDIKISILQSDYPSSDIKTLVTWRSRPWEIWHRRFMHIYTRAVLQTTTHTRHRTEGALVSLIFCSTK